MSEEEKLSIVKLDDEEVSATFSQTNVALEDTVCITEEQEASFSVKEFTGHAESPGQQVLDEVSIDNFDEVPDDGVPAAKDNDESGFLYSSNENLNFGEPPSSSTSVMTRETSIVSHWESDKTPLLRNRSSATDSCLGTDADGDNDNTSEASCGCSYHDDRECNHISMVSIQTRESLMIPGSIRVPIVGHETMEARSKFTVFKIHVMVDDDELGWFIFRRYSDFAHLNDQLRILFPNFRLTLPPKRWFKSNFDLEFLEDRQKGLQFYVDTITGLRDMCNSKPVRDFFCFDDPPGPHDSLEESRAQCECMEEMVYLLRKELSEKDTELELLKEELDLYKNQVLLLSNRLSELNRPSNTEKPAAEKHGSQPDDEQVDINIIAASEDIILTNNLDPSTEIEELNRPSNTEKPADEKHRSQPDDEQLDIDTIAASGDIIFTNNLDPSTEIEKRDQSSLPTKNFLPRRELNRPSNTEKPADEKHRSQPDDEQLDIDIIAASGDIILTNNLDPSTEIETQELDKE